MQKSSKILVIGHQDVIENSLGSYFARQGFDHVFLSGMIGWDVLNQANVKKFFEEKRPEYVFLGSVRSGGIAANQKFSAEFIYENLEAQNNIVHAAYTFGVKKLLFLAGSCVYPKESLQPIKEKYLLTGPLEETSEAYSVAKIAGIKLCQAYQRQYKFDAIVAIPATIYGPGSDANQETAHVIGALIGKFTEAKLRNEKSVVVWGTGKPQREFIYADDFVESCLFLMEKYKDEEPINIGCGRDVSIKELASLIADISGFKGEIIFDKTKPDGTMRKLLDNQKIEKLGWKPKVDLKEGITKTYDWYLKQKTAELKK
ncbi:MAG: GDP-L-fucose synthase [Candidatus Omnitrophota bacterium]